MADKSSVNFQLEPPDPAKKKRRFKAKPGKRAKQRSMELLRKDGYLVGNAEYWSEHAGRTIDLFGFADLVVLGVEEKEIIAVQVTKGFLKEHIAKIRANKNATAWLACKGRIMIHLWRELGSAGQKVWVLDVIEVTEAGDSSKPEQKLF